MHENSVVPNARVNYEIYLFANLMQLRVTAVIFFFLHERRDIVFDTSFELQTTRYEVQSIALSSFPRVKISPPERNRAFLKNYSRRSPNFDNSGN